MLMALGKSSYTLRLEQSPSSFIAEGDKGDCHFIACAAAHSDQPADPQIFPKLTINRYNAH